MAGIERRKDRIVETATREFLGRGYAAVSVRDIIEALAMSKGGFYHHFPSKELLFTTVVEALLEDWRQSIEGAISDPAATAEAKLRGVFLSPLERDGQAYALLYEGSRELEGIRRLVGLFVSELVGRCEEVLREGQAAGEIRDFLDCGSWAFQIVATVEGANLLAGLGGGEGLRERLLQAFESTWRSIRALSI